MKKRELDWYSGLIIKMKDIIALYARTESGDEYLRVYNNVIDTTKNER